MLRLLRRPFAAPALALALGACGATQPEPRVPPPRTELVPAPPPSPVLLVWRPGHYDWTGGGYVWRPGEWVNLAGHGTSWRDGYWQRIGTSFVWTPGHWM